MSNSRPLLAPVVALLAIVLCGARSPAQTVRSGERSIESSGKKLYTPRTAAAIKTGLKFIASRQRADGSFGSGRFRENVAVTALCGMSFLAAGHSPGRGKYGKNVREAVAYLLKRTASNGYIVEEDVRYHGPMYGHGFATMFLAECFGMTHSKRLKAELKRKLKLAVALIVKAQNKQGGWRYTPDTQQSDVSVTVCQVMALRAARNAGLYVPKQTIDNAVTYLKKCQNRDGGFRYQLTLRVTSDFPRSAAGVVALYSAGIYKGPEIASGLRYLRNFLPRGGVPRKGSYYYYGHYYAVQAMWQAGGAHWREWYPAIRDELLSDRETDGRWSDELICDEYATAMACLILQMPVNYLPIFQR